MHNSHRILGLAAAVAAAFLPLHPAQANGYSNVTIKSSDNIFGSGNTVDSLPNPGGGGGGTVAMGYKFDTGINRILSFSSVTGTVSPDFGSQPTIDYVGPDGGNAINGAVQNLQSYKGISGIVNNDPGHTFALVGVFTVGNDPLDPNDPAPARLDFTGHESDFSFSPLLNQTFFIGDGLTGTGTGAEQQFNVPGGANFLYLGYADGDYFGDASQVGSGGSPAGFYGDNTGQLTASFQVNSAPVPEFGTSVSFGAMLMLGLGGLAWRSRRKPVTE